MTHEHSVQLTTAACFPAMTIWVDADAMPGEVKRVMFKAAEREKIALVLVANVPLKHPDSSYINSMVVDGGFNVADDWIAEKVVNGDLVVTADIPLAARAVESGGTALDPRGKMWTSDNIQAKLATRNLLDDLRGASLVEGGGPRPYSKKDLHRFASAFHGYLVSRRGSSPATQS